MLREFSLNLSGPDSEVFRTSNSELLKASISLADHPSQSAVAD
jgi:hypothetical protein